MLILGYVSLGKPRIGDLEGAEDPMIKTKTPSTYGWNAGDMAKQAIGPMIADRYIEHSHDEIMNGFKSIPVSSVNENPPRQIPNLTQD